MQKARVASVCYLNALPLTWGLQHGSQRQLFDLTFHSPAECARLLQEGMADMALIPSVEFERIRGLTAVSGLGVVSRREVRSVLLMTRVPPSRIGTLAVDTNSRTSAALARIVLRRRHGARPAVVAMPPDPRAMLARCDAALVIGDPALRVSVNPESAAPGAQMIDLAREWQELTGLPFVFAIWACRPVLQVAAIRETLEASLHEGLRSIETIARDESVRTGLAPEVIVSYLRDNIHYRVGQEEAGSLRLFFRLCREEGLIPGYDRPASSPIRSVTANNG